MTTFHLLSQSPMDWCSTRAKLCLLGGLLCVIILLLLNGSDVAGVEWGTSGMTGKGGALRSTSWWLSGRKGPTKPPVRPVAATEGPSSDSPCNDQPDVVLTTSPDFDADAFCKSIPMALDPTRTLHARPVPNRIYYGIMMNKEVDMLEVVLQEIYPVVDKIILVESTVSHSLKPKESFVKTLFVSNSTFGTRFSQFSPKIIHQQYTPRRKYVSGWDIEKRQRQVFIGAAMANGILEGDVAVANMDLDELINYKMLLKLRYCSEDPEVADDPKRISFDLVHFRYHLNCLTEPTATRYMRTIFYWRDGYLPSLYMLRKASGPIVIPNLTDVSTFMRDRQYRLAWHMSTFGGVEGILQKRQNSPHRFVSETENSEAKAEVEKNSSLSFDDANAIVMQRQINECVFRTPRTLVSVTRDVLPRALQNPSSDCKFLKSGFIKRRPPPPPV